MNDRARNAVAAEQDAFHGTEILVAVLGAKYRRARGAGLIPAA